jgi:hypothetical protein
VGGRGNWNLSTKAARWKEALEGNNKGARQKPKDDDKMQINLAQVGDKWQKDQPFGPHLEKLTPELRLKLMQEKRCFRCRQVGHMASSNKCPLFNAKTQAEKQERRSRWEWEKKDQTQSPPAYARATNAPTQKPPTLEDLVAQIKNLSHKDSDKLLEKIIATKPKEEGGDDEKDPGF